MKTRESKATQNPKEMFRFAQHDKIPCVIASEQRERGNQPCAKLESWGFYAV
ncbi:MAG: hypothetical protein K2N69_02210 [Helicobacter sp.]|nr:hypothetical protein [Helicobacter sp.]